MLKVLEYSVEFPTTGRSFASRIEFAPGLTTITGRNEAGKTVVLEMIGYCLFGKAALRGLASDYRNLTASLSLNVRDKEVQISREPRRETLTVDGKEAAVGADAINKAIPALLGFGLDVFNIACAAQQGDIGALTEMRPTARRQMVDQLIGLNQLEEVEKLCRTEARDRSTLAESLSLNINEPQKPEKPENYHPTEEMRTHISQRESLRLRYQQFHAMEPPKPPVKPEAPENTDVAALESHEADRQQTLQNRARWEGKLAAIPEPKHTRKELDAAIAYRDYSREAERRGPKPDFTVEELDEMLRVWTQIEWAASDETITCPECSHVFLQVNPEIDLEEINRLEQPKLSRTEITEQQRRHELWSSKLPKKKKVLIESIDQEVLAHTRAEDRAKLIAELAKPLPEDKSEELRLARQYASQLAVYEEKSRTYDRDLKNYRLLEADFIGLVLPSDEEIAELHECLSASTTYERQSAFYNNAIEQFQTVMEQVTALRSEADGFTRGSTALAATRVAVKSELAPSLSRAASSLISSMTGGERNRVVVDHDFEVTVDGQPLQTLSGSGKSVVNLALRIGIGQVLTSSVLPIFLGDEIDAAMDSDRAGTTHETMQTLREYLTQIILVTHKDLEADQTISLGT